MTEKIDTIIVGGGQAGLATSYYLTQKGCEHIIFEKAPQAGNAWRNDRWDSFALLTPNWTFRLPGAEYQGTAPEGFMPRDEIVAAFEAYVDRFHLPVRYGMQVSAVEANRGGSGYRVRANGSEWEARNVVMATGLFQRPKTHPSSAQISSRITQLHSGRYRNPMSIPPGAVLVIGSAQSGCQIAEELYLSGRRVYLSTSSAGRAPRRYRGKDVFEWMHLSGTLDRTVDKLPSPRAKFAANPQVSGRDGGRTLNLHKFARDGVKLVGSFLGGEGFRVWFTPNLKENLSKSDKFETELVKMIDGYIAEKGLDVPKESLPVLKDGYAAEEITELDLLAAGIQTIIWAVGYAFDFNFVRLSAFDTDGYPVQQQGVTDFPGLYFVGLPWLYKQKSGLLVGMGEDAAYIASAIAAREME